MSSQSKRVMTVLIFIVLAAILTREAPPTALADSSLCCREGSYVEPTGCTTHCIPDDKPEPICSSGVFYQYRTAGSCENAAGTCTLSQEPNHPLFFLVEYRCTQFECESPHGVPGLQCRLEPDPGIPPPVAVQDCSGTPCQD